MKRKEHNRQFFLVLLRAGLFQISDTRIFAEGISIDWGEIYRLAEEQSVVGLVSAGIEYLPPPVRPPKQVVLRFVGNAFQLEQRNLAMNVFIAQMIGKLRESNIESVLVKGQGVAQCYAKPLWRASGDIDLLLSEKNYKNAKEVLRPLASYVSREDKDREHIAYTIDNWVVELHGTLRNHVLSKLNNVVDEVQRDVLLRRRFRTWMNGEAQVFLPAPDEDVFIVFSHIIQHYFEEGIGLRQICDWCCLMRTFRLELNEQLLESRIKRARITSEWKAFAALAVKYLGMQVDSLPLYSSKAKWSRKADSIIELVLEVGNFGHNRDNSYRKKSSFYVRKTISLWRLTHDTMKQFFIFPLDSVKVWLARIGHSIKGLFNVG